MGARYGLGPSAGDAGSSAISSVAVNRQTFDTFRVTPENSAAVVACRALAQGAFHQALPLTLYGTPGSGKSHLVWAILNEVRGGAARIGIALVLARDFPERVRKLPEDPAPLRRGQSIILLVDELELFREDAPALEAVVRLFHDQGHTVALSSNVHPDRLTSFSEAFRDFLKEGTLIEVLPAGKHRNVDVVALQAQVARLEAEKAALMPEQERADLLQARLEDSEGRIAAAEAARDDLMARVTSLEGAIAELEQEKSILQKQVGAQDPLQQELGAVRKLLSEAVADAEAALAQQARLQGQLSAAREQLEAEAEERAALNVERQRLDEEARALQERLIAARAEAGRQQEVLRLSLEEVFASLAQMQASGGDRERLQFALNEAWSRIDALEAASQAPALAGTLEQLQAENAHLEALLEEARAERGRQKVTLDGASGRIRGLQGELEKAQKQMRIQTAEMDALRLEAASQVAGATIRLGEVENELGRYREAWETVESLRREVRADMREVQRLITAGAQASERLSARMLNILRVQPQRPSNEHGPNAPAAMDLFEAIPEALPEPDPPEGQPT